MVWEGKKRALVSPFRLSWVPFRVISFQQWTNMCACLAQHFCLWWTIPSTSKLMKLHAGHSLEEWGIVVLDNHIYLLLFWNLSHFCSRFMSPWKSTDGPQVFMVSTWKKVSCHSSHSNTCINAQLFKLWGKKRKINWIATHSVQLYLSIQWNT